MYLVWSVDIFDETIRQGVLQPAKPGKPGIIREIENASGKPENIREFEKNS